VKQAEIILMWKRRPSTVVSSLACAALIVLWGMLRLVVATEYLLPLTYVLPLLICIWTRRLWQLWLCAGAFAILATVKMFWLYDAVSLTQRNIAYISTLVNILVGGLAIHLIIHLRSRLEDYLDRLRTSNETITLQNDELQAQSEELAQQSEELAQQNEELAQQNEELAQQNDELAEQGEELQTQQEELEVQNEELRVQTDEIRSLNLELTSRENILQRLLDAGRPAACENIAIGDACRLILELLGKQAGASMLFELQGDNLVLRAESGLGLNEPDRLRLPLAGSFAGIVMAQGRTAALQNVHLRPDLSLPDLPDGRQIASVMTSPLFINGQVAGVVMICGWQVWPWNEEQFRLMNWFAGQCSAIMETLHLQRELRQSRDHLEARIIERTAELARRADQLARLSNELTIAEQRERRRLAEVLHDHLQQLLVGASMQIDFLRAEQKDPKSRQTLDLIHDILGEAIQSTRSLTHDLSPPILLRGGAGAILQWLAGQMQEKQNLQVTVEADSMRDNLPEGIVTLLYTSAREFLLNVVKHAGVQTATLKLNCREDCVTLEVCDQGQGFDPRVLSDRQFVSHGFGLFSIRERAELLGGNLQIDSRPGAGSRFCLTLPDDISENTPLIGKAVESQQLGPENRPHENMTKNIAAPDNSNRVIRVLLVDDHMVVRQGLCSLLEKHELVDVVGQADNGNHALTLVERLQPDVIMMDVSMPEMDGIEATRAIKQRWPEIKIIGLSMFDEQELAGRMQRAGADAYLSKTGPSDLLLETLLKICFAPSRCSR
jgi:signal transduction histidine kinase/CheY-like chemotaxis protein